MLKLFRKNLKYFYMDNTALIKEVTAKANVWLDGNYDAETKKEVKSLLDNPDKAEAMANEARHLGETHTNQVVFDKWNNFLYSL